MLELFLGAVDRIIIFLKGRQDARRRIFNDIFTPAFDDICLIHAESIKLLTDVQKSLGNIEDERLDQEALFGYNQTTGPLGGKYVADLNKTQAALELRRVEYQATKGKLKATLTAMSKSAATTSLAD